MNTKRDRHGTISSGPFYPYIEPDFAREDISCLDFITWLRVQMLALGKESEGACQYHIDRNDEINANYYLGRSSLAYMFLQDIDSFLEVPHER